MAVHPPNLARRRAVALVSLLLLAATAVVLLARGDADTGDRAGLTGAGAAAGAAASPAAARAAAGAADLPLGRALGQTLVGRYAGRVPPDAFVARIRRGELGAVILFADNVAGGVRVTRKVVDGLQQAAKAGGNPPLLVMVDQEGGVVKRLPGAPDRPARAMDSAAVARVQGAATGRLLRRAGITLDLAPVADVTRVRGSFLGTRSFGTDPRRVAERACAFAAGLRAEGVAAALKHFPGLGRARGNTDDGRITIPDRAAAIRSDWAAYARCAGASRTAVMMSSAAYPALLGGDAPAVLSAAAYTRELRRAGVPASTLTISDDLDAGAIAGRDRPAHRALQAGLDLLLYAAGPASSAQAHRVLLEELRRGELSEARVRDAAASVLRLKAQLP